jgi:hypothetical protein
MKKFVIGIVTLFVVVTLAFVAILMSINPEQIINKHKDDIAQQVTQKLGRNWSLGAQLFFTPREVGSYVVLEADVAEDGKYELDVYFTKSYDYAIVQVSVDGKKLGNPIDTYCPRVAHMGKVPIGTISLKAGKHKIKFEALGKNEKSKGVYMGIDCFTLKKVK